MIRIKLIDSNGNIYQEYETDNIEYISNNKIKFLSKKDNKNHILILNTLNIEIIE